MQNHPQRIVTLQIEVESAEKASLVFAGRLYEYRDRFQDKGIAGGFPGDGEDRGRYVRVMKSLDVSEDTEVEKVRAVDVFPIRM